MFQFDNMFASQVFHYENERLTNKNIIIDCGEKLSHDGDFLPMIVSPTPLSMAMDEPSDTRTHTQLNLSETDPCVPLNNGGME